MFIAATEAADDWNFRYIYSADSNNTSNGNCIAFLNM